MLSSKSAIHTWEPSESENKSFVITMKWLQPVSTMTISYSKEVVTSSGFGCFLKLLKRWRASIYKLVWPDLLLFLFLYYVCAFVYRVLCNTEEQKVTFEYIVDYCHHEVSAIPLSFVLGFYVALVVKRWWEQFQAIPIPDALAVFVSSLLQGNDERGRIMRRSIMRYAILSEVMVMSDISPSVKRRFPTYDHLVKFGLLTESEQTVLIRHERNFHQTSEFWMPITWAGSVVTRARKEGRISDDFSVKSLIDELNKFRRSCGLLLQYDTLPIPLVYTQVVTLVVYSYFFFDIMGTQWTERKDKSGYVNHIDYYFPLFNTLEFFFYVGWLKVAETLINPFGDDDDDFELNFTIDRDVQLSYFIVDEMHNYHPELLKDQYWNRDLPKFLPYFNKTKKKKKIRYEQPPRPSTAGLFNTKKDTSKDTAYRNDFTPAESYHHTLRSSLGFLNINLRNRFRGAAQSMDSIHVIPSEPSAKTSMPIEIVQQESLISESYLPRPETTAVSIFDSSSSDEKLQKVRPIDSRQQLLRPFSSQVSMPIEIVQQTSLLSETQLPRPEAPAISIFDSSSSDDVINVQLHRGHKKKRHATGEVPKISDFERLRQERQREGHERRQQRLARHTFILDNFDNVIEINEDTAKSRRTASTEQNYDRRHLDDWRESAVSEQSGYSKQSGATNKSGDSNQSDSSGRSDGTGQSANSQADAGTIDSQRGSSQDDAGAIDIQRGSSGQPADSQDDAGAIDTQRRSSGQPADSQADDGTKDTQGGSQA